jgi:hypothetical protein
MEFSDPTIIKLKTGDDIIATVRDVTKTRMVLENPFTLETLTLIDQNGVPRDERILMKKWINWTKDNVISLPKAHILDCMPPSDKAVAHYLMVLKNGGIFKLNATEQAELEAGASFMEELLEQIKSGEVTPEMIEEGRIESERMEEIEASEPEQLPDEDKNGGSDKDYGNRPNDRSPDPRDYF